MCIDLYVAVCINSPFHPCTPIGIIQRYGHVLALAHYHSDRHFRSGEQSAVLGSVQLCFAVVSTQGGVLSGVEEVGGAVAH